ncbi:MAG: SDR family oxidoreductase [Acidimicrobiales bacterium]|nr:SDR family oxidoreductase [Acidimicrobiales bacterium]MCB9372137.1 SDR family oxidoreductase [Microthrixaceae bacterium]
MAPRAPYFVDGEVALVTGGGGGIGRATAVLFAAEGARVVVVDVDADGLAGTVAEVEAAGGEGVAVTADVTDEAQVEAAVAAAVDRFGRLDCAHNNAGTSGTPSPFTDLSREDWDRVVTLNLTGVFLGMKHELRVMAPAGRGAIVNTSSGAGIIGFPSLPHYVASKHGVLGLTKTAAQEFARSGIRVNAVCPGTTDTPMMQAFIGGDPGVEQMMRRTVPTGEMGRPDQIAEAVVWLCSDRASFVNGETMLVDGGTVCR